MMRAYYDLHIHSCLSPCGDDDSTPGNIVGMAKLKGLDVIALTDHNTCKNCRAAVKLGERFGVMVLPGMELCTSEDIHVVCLFERLEGAEAFAGEIDRLMPDIPNRPDIFGHQHILNEEDEIVGEEPRLLITAAAVGVNRVAGMARRYGGAAFPAHIDKPANGILGVLGGIPPEAAFTAAELSPVCDGPAFLVANPVAAGLRILRNSDAHYLWQISEREHWVELPELTRGRLIEHINRRIAQ